MVIVMVALIIQGRFALPPILIGLSTIVTLILALTGFLGEGPMGVLEALKTLTGFLNTGLSSVLNTVALFTFSVVFFNVLGDAGMFDTIISKVMKYIGNNISVILLMTCLLCTISHLDGSGATTMLITIPTMLPLFKKMRISPVILLLYVGLVSGVVNMLPWTSALARVSAAVGVEPRDIWSSLLPVQVVGLILLYGSCFVLGPILKKRGFGMTDAEFAELRESMLKPADPVLKVSKGVVILDIVLTLVLMVCLLLGWINTNLAFMIALSIALVTNCKDSKEMTSQIRKHGSAALNMVMILFSIGMFVGVMKDSGMMNAMTDTMVGLLPESMGSHFNFIISLLSVPLSMVIGSDAVYMVATPIFSQISIAYGGTALAACAATVVGSCIAANLCLVAPTPYLALGLAGVEMKDNLKYCFLPTWILGIILAIVGAVVGAYAF